MKCACIRVHSRELALKEQTSRPVVWRKRDKCWPGYGFRHPPPPKNCAENRAEPGVRRHVPVSRVSVWLCNCFSICFLSVVARCSPPAACRRREARGTPQAVKRDPFHPPPFIKKEQHGPVLCCGPLVQHTRDNQMIPFYSAY